MLCDNLPSTCTQAQWQLQGKGRCGNARFSNSSLDRFSWLQRGPWNVELQRFFLGGRPTHSTRCAWPWSRCPCHGLTTVTALLEERAAGPCCLCTALARGKACMALVRLGWYARKPLNPKPPNPKPYTVWVQASSAWVERSALVQGPVMVQGLVWIFGLAGQNGFRVQHAHEFREGAMRACSSLFVCLGWIRSLACNWGSCLLGCSQQAR